MSDSMGFLFLNTTKDGSKKFLRGTLDVNGEKVKVVGFMGEGTDKEGKPYKGFVIRADVPEETKNNEVKKKKGSVDVTDF